MHSDQRQKNTQKSSAPLSHLHPFYLPDVRQLKEGRQAGRGDMDSATNNATTNNNNWRNELSQDSRQKIVNKIMDTLQRHMPFTGPDGINELRKIALRFEEKIYAAAGDQQDYLHKISLKMLSLRNHVSQDGNPLAGGSSSSNQEPLDPGLMIPPQLRNTSHSPALVNGNGISLPGQSQPQQALLQQNLKSGQVLPQNTHPASVQGQMQSRQQQVAQQHQQPQAQHQLLYQQPLQHQQQHLQNPQEQVILKENLEQSQLVPSILQQQQQPVMQQSQLQATQQPILQSAQAPTFQTSQQSLIRESQPSVLQPAQQSNLQQTSESFLQQHQQSFLRQQQSVLRQQPPILQQQQPSIFNVSNMQTQQQQQQQLQQIIQYKNSQYQQAQQPSPSFLQPQSQQLQQQPQLQQLFSQLQHQPQQLQQQQPLLTQSNSVQQELQQRLRTPGGLLQQQQQQNSVEQQKQLLQAQNQRLSDVPTSQTGQSNVIDWQEKIYQKLQKLKDIYFPDLRELIQRLTVKCQQPMAGDQLEKLMVYRGKVQRMMQYFQVSKNNIPPGFPEDKIDAVEKQIQYVLNSFKPGKPALQQHGQQQPLLPQSNSVQQELQQRLHMPGGLLQQQQQQNSVEQKKQLLQAQNQRLSEVPTTSMASSGQTGQSNVIDWQEKIYQKLQKLKDIYFPDLRELIQRLTVKCQQPMAADQLEKLMVYRGKVQRMMQYFQVSKNNIPPGFPEDKIDAVEKHIQYVLNSFKRGKPALQQQQGHQQFLPHSNSHLPSMQQQPESTSFYRSPNNSTEWILSKDLPFTGPDGMNELRKIVLPFEEKIYATAVDQQDYLRKIYLKALSLRNHVSRDGNPLAGASSSSN